MMSLLVRMSLLVLMSCDRFMLSVCLHLFGSFLFLICVNLLPPPSCVQNWIS